jgi:GNAT superfamily N-acetyltransferase
MITVSIETVAENDDEIRRLVSKYWSESDERRDSFEDEIDLDSYLNLNELGFLVLYVARDEAEEFVGFLPVIESPCLHTGKEKAIAEMVYVNPTHRGQGIAKKLIQYAEKELKDNGSSILYFTLKTEFPHNGLVQSLGYTHVENVYMRIL